MNTILNYFLEKIMKPKLTATQRNVLRHIEVIGKKEDASLREFHRKSYIALQNKGLIKLDEGYWVIINGIDTATYQTS